MSKITDIKVDILKSSSKSQVITYITDSNGTVGVGEAWFNKLARKKTSFTITFGTVCRVWDVCEWVVSCASLLQAAFAWHIRWLEWCYVVRRATLSDCLVPWQMVVVVDRDRNCRNSGTWNPALSVVAFHFRDPFGDAAGVPQKRNLEPGPLWQWTSHNQGTWNQILKS